jgi:C-terminal processing protease CtpA/Prc
LAVLIDEGTASMGEVFAVNVQEHGVGRLFGATTMGSVAASQVLPLVDGSALQLAVMQIYSGQGQRLNREGVHPDQEVELRLEDLQTGRDPQMEAAAAYLRSAAAAPAAAIPIAPAAALTVGTKDTTTAASGDVWPTRLGFSAPLPLVSTGRYSATVTFTAIAR